MGEADFTFEKLCRISLLLGVNKMNTKTFYALLAFLGITTVGANQIIAQTNGKAEEGKVEENLTYKTLTQTIENNTVYHGGRPWLVLEKDAPQSLSSIWNSAEMFVQADHSRVAINEFEEGNFGMDYAKVHALAQIMVDETVNTGVIRDGERIGVRYETRIETRTVGEKKLAFLVYDWFRDDNGEKFVLQPGDQIPAPDSPFYRSDTPLELGVDAVWQANGGGTTINGVRASLGYGFEDFVLQVGVSYMFGRMISNEAVPSSHGVFSGTRTDTYDYLEGAGLDIGFLWNVYSKLSLGLFGGVQQDSYRLASTTHEEKVEFGEVTAEMDFLNIDNFKMLAWMIGLNARVDITDRLRVNGSVGYMIEDQTGHTIPSWNGKSTIFSVGMSYDPDFRGLYDEVKDVLGGGE